MSKSLLQQLADGHPPQGPQEPTRPVPYRVQVAMRLIDLYSCKSSRGVIAASATEVPATDLSKSEQATYDACLQVVRNYVIGEDGCVDIEVSDYDDDQ